jgi:hypothetical protein
MRKVMLLDKELYRIPKLGAENKEEGQEEIWVLYGGYGCSAL